ncbi:hypothetical protein MBRA1_001374 [Malassezia brasiliensis]|uniref:Uncharacterized protein n=1 Tax=Malassezia brasiliensis TaxID=1821822 RepID=A0AAF0IPB0_9BASI|nr:hypothetical protein MBRA1_001374 [Malassezia brasiliensis]
MSLSFGPYDFGTSYARWRDAVTYSRSVSPNARPTRGFVGQGPDRAQAIGKQNMCVWSRDECYDTTSGLGDTGLVSFASIFGILSLVIAYYIYRRRAKLEYGFLLLFTLLEFIGLAVGFDGYQNVMLIMYSVAISAQLIRLANLCYEKRAFSLLVYHPAFIALVVGTALAMVGIAGWGKYWYTWMVFLVFFLGLWFAVVFALGRNYRLKSQFLSGAVTSEHLEGQWSKRPMPVSHKQLNTMIIILAVIVSLLTIKCVFLIVVGASWQTGTVYDFSVEVFQVLCVLPDLALTVVLCTYGTLDLYAISQYILVPDSGDESESTDVKPKAKASSRRP